MKDIAMHAATLGARNLTEPSYRWLLSVWLLSTFGKGEAIRMSRSHKLHHLRRFKAIFKSVAVGPVIEEISVLPRDIDEFQRIAPLTFAAAFNGEAPAP